MPVQKINPRLAAKMIVVRSYAELNPGVAANQQVDHAPPASLVLELPAIVETTLDKAFAPLTWRGENPHRARGAFLDAVHFAIYQERKYAGFVIEYLDRQLKIHPHLEHILTKAMDIARSLSLRPEPRPAPAL